MSQLFASGGKSIRVSASTSVLPVNTQDYSVLKKIEIMPLAATWMGRRFILSDGSQEKGNIT